MNALAVLLANSAFAMITLAVITLTEPSYSASVLSISNLETTTRIQSAVRSKDIQRSQPTAALLELLAADWRRFNLPEPSPRAKLAYSHPLYPVRKQNLTPRLCFIEPATHGSRLASWYRFEKFRLSGSDVITFIDSSQNKLTLSKEEQEFYSQPFGSNNESCLAVYLWLRNERKAALSLFSVALKKCKSEPRHDLAVTAWNYWLDALGTASTNRLLALTSLRKIHSSSPGSSLQQNSFYRVDLPEELRTRENVLRNLKLTLEPSKAKPDSLEADIDLFIESPPWALNEKPGKIAAAGFDAIPVLIKHLNDTRLTRERVIGINAAPTYIMQVGEVIAQYLQSFDPLNPALAFEWDPLLLRNTLNRAAVERWYEGIRGINEEQYLVDHFLSTDPSGFQGTNLVVLAIVEAKYPHRLPDLWRAVVHSSPSRIRQHAAYALWRSNLPLDNVVSMLVEGASVGPLRERAIPLDILIKARSPRATQPLIDLMAAYLPEEENPNGMRTAQAISSWTAELDEPSAWKALTELLDRVGIEKKIEMLANLGDYRSKLPSRRHVLEFAKRYEDDQTRWNRSENIPYHISYLAGLTVGDAALISVSNLLGDYDYPHAGWPEDAWKNWRSKTRSLMKKYLSRNTAEY